MTEQQRYRVLGQFPGFELRRYPAHLVAEVEVADSFANAGNRAFRILAAYISGRNSAQRSIAMTAPVVQQASSRIAMTAPVIQESDLQSGRHVVGFVMPAEFTRQTLPAPSDPRVQVREVAEQDAVVSRFTGRWTESVYRERLADLHKAATAAGFQIGQPPRFARFDPPWTPWFMRRNEIVLPVVGNPTSGPSAS